MVEFLFGTAFGILIGGIFATVRYCVLMKKETENIRDAYEQCLKASHYVSELWQKEYEKQIMKRRNKE